MDEIKWYLDKCIVLIQALEHSIHAWKMPINVRWFKKMLQHFFLGQAAQIFAYLVREMYGVFAQAAEETNPWSSEKLAGKL